MKFFTLVILLTASSVTAYSQSISEYFGKSAGQIKAILIKRANVTNLESVDHDSKNSDISVKEFAQIFSDGSKVYKVFTFRNGLCSGYFIQSNTRDEHERKSYELGQLAEQGSTGNEYAGSRTKAWAFKVNGMNIIAKDSYYDTYLDQQPGYSMGYSFETLD